MARARISPWRRMRRSRAPSNGLGRFFAAQFSAGCTTNMSGFDCRQAHLTTRVAAPPNKLVAGRAILVTERQPGTAATRQPSEFGHSHDALPEPIALDRASRSVIGRRATGRFAAGY